MAKRKWNEEATMVFVHEYTHQECLWNRKNKGYNNKNARDLAYLEIAKNMNLGEEFGIPEVKNKIKNLRNTYTQKIQKIRDFKKQGLVHVPSLKWFHIMDGVLKNGDKKPNKKIHSDEEDFKSEEIQQDVKKKKPITTSLKIRKIKNKIKKDVEQVDMLDNSHIETSPIIYTKHPKTKIQPLIEHTQDEFNEFEAFGKLISYSLKNMSSERAIHTQQFIHTYLNKQRLLQIRSDGNINKQIQETQQQQQSIEYETSEDEKSSEIDPFFKME